MRFRSPLLSQSRFLSFPPGTEMVHFPGFPRPRLCIQRAVTRVHRVGFPHSEIPGSKPACGSPRLIAACHVLHRLLAPRHPLYALSSLIIKLTQSVFGGIVEKHGSKDPPLQNHARRPDFRSSIHPRFSSPQIPGMRFTERRVTRISESPRDCNRLSFLRSSRQLNKPPFHPQFCSISNKTCNNPHLHSLMRTVIRTK